MHTRKAVKSKLPPQKNKLRMGIGRVTTALRTLKKNKIK